VGTLAAIGPNAIGAALGAFVGGRLGDLLGRKRIYQYDLIVYAIGVAVIACAVNTAMLLIGAVVVGVAVGADVPTSLALVGKFAPSKARGQLLGFSQVAWNAGPVVVLVLALILTPTGMIGARVLFLMLFLARSSPTRCAVEWWSRPAGRRRAATRRRAPRTTVTTTVRRRRRRSGQPA